MSGMRQLKAIAVAMVFPAALVAAPPAAWSSAATRPSTLPARRETKHGWFAPRVRGRAVPKLPAEVTKAFVIPIRDRETGITPTTYDSIKRKVTQCKGRGAQLVIFDMNTPGGRSDAMSDIVKLITDDLKDVYTVAYVRPEAISAGAIVSLACSEIVMTPDGTIGDAMPIMIVGGKLVPIPKLERGKIESYARSQIRHLAERNGHNRALCEAMITLAREVWLIRHPETREVRLVDPDAKNWRAKIADAPGAKGDKDSGDKARWEFLDRIDREDELVTLTATEARDIAFVDHLIEAPADDPFAGLREHYNIAGAPVVLEDTGLEALVSFLTSPAVTSVLLMAGIFCVYMEMNTPGFGVAGGLAIACFAVMFGSRYLIGLAQWWEIGLFALGLMLLAVEILVIPGFGVAGVAGIFCCIVGLLAMVVPNAPTEFPWPTSELDWSWFSNGLFAIGLGFVLGIIAASVAARFLPKIPVASRLVLAPAAAADDAPVTPGSPMMHIKVGDVGVVSGTCRPVGMVRFGDELFDAVADGTFIEEGARVRVLKREGNRLVVEET